MKKLLVIAMFAVLAASSFAAELTLGGTVEYWGVFVNAQPEASGADDQNASFNHYLARFDGKLAIADTTSFGFRMRFQDDWVGKETATTGTGGSMAERYWLEHKLLGNKLTVSLGRMGQSHGAGLFARDWFDQQIGLNGRPNPSSTRDMIKAEWALSDTNKLFFIVDKAIESDTGGDSGTNDRVAYIAGANIKSGDVSVNPSLSYLHGQDDSAFGLQVNGKLAPATGFQAEGAFAMYKQQGDVLYAGEKPMLFGLMLDLGYATDSWKAGFIAAYGSSDEDANAAFNFGDDWNKTKIIDDGLWLAGSGVPPTGATQLALYADVEVNENLTISPIFAYYIFTDQSRWHNASVSEDASMMEIDLNAKYKLATWSDKTGLTLGAGLAYAMTSDIMGKNSDSGHNDLMAYWNVIATF